MSWKELLSREIDYSYKITMNLFDMVDENGLDWKPTTGTNWLTMGQLLHHITTACGVGMKGFVTGDWGMPEGMDLAEMSPDEMLPPAEKFPAVETIEVAKSLLEEDKKIALEMLESSDESRLASEPSAAPWDPTEMILGHRLLQMVAHLNSHTHQLFYYLKLQDIPVHTGHLWGM